MERKTTHIRKVDSGSYTTISDSKDYGYLWWLNSDKKWKNVPSGAFYALGYGGNYIIVDKENDMVIVIRWVNDKVEEVLNLIYQSMVKSSGDYRDSIINNNGILQKLYFSKHELKRSVTD